MYLRQILSAEIFYSRVLQMLPAKAFTLQAVSQKPRVSIFGTRRLSNAAKVPSYRNVDKKTRGAFNPGMFGQAVRGGKKVAPLDQLTFEDPLLLRNTVNIIVEDHNPKAPINVLKFNQKVS